MSDGRENVRAGRRVRVPQRAGAPAKRRIELYLMIGCLLMIVNMLFLMRIQSQLSDMNKALSQVLGTLVARQGEGEMGNPGKAVAQGEKEEVMSPRYQAAPGGTSQKEAEEVDYVKLCGLDQVDRPVDRTPSQVLKRLEELAEEDETIAEIYDNHSLYPDDMLDALANNPEMADFAKNFLTAGKESTGAGLTKAEKKQDYPLFLQWDPRWGYVSYGDDSNVGLAGCGPTCLSMMLYYLLGDENLTPDVIAEYSMENGYYMAGTGTAWKFLEDVARNYGITVEQPKARERTFKDELDKGNIIICSMKPGDFTAGGHFIVIYGYDSKGFLVNDPNCVARSRQAWDFDDISSQIKHSWVFAKE